MMRSLFNGTGLLLRKKVLFKQFFKLSSDVVDCNVKEKTTPGTVILMPRESEVIGNFQKVLQTMFPIKHYKVTDKFDCFKNKTLNQNQLILEANSFYGHTILIDTDDFVSVLPQIKAVMDNNGRGKSCIYVVRGSGTGKTVSMQLLQLAAMRDTELKDTVALAFTFNHKTTPGADLSGNEAELAAGVGTAPLGKGPRMAFALSVGNRLLSAALDENLGTVVHVVRSHLDLLESSPENDAELYLVACLRHIVDTLRAAGVVVERLLISADEIVAAEEAVERRFGHQGVVALHKVMTRENVTPEEVQAAKTQILSRWGPDTLQKVLDLSPSMGEAEKVKHIMGFDKVSSTNVSKILRSAVLDHCHNFGNVKTALVISSLKRPELDQNDKVDSGRLFEFWRQAERLSSSRVVNEWLLEEASAQPPRALNYVPTRYYNTKEGRPADIGMVCVANPISVSAEDRFKLTLIADTLSDVPRGLEYAKLYIDGVVKWNRGKRELVVDRQFVTGLFASVESHFGGKYSTGKYELPPAKVMKAILLQNEISVDTEGVAEAVRTSYVTNALSGDPDIKPRGNLVVMAACASAMESWENLETQKEGFVKNVLVRSLVKLYTRAIATVHAEPVKAGVDLEVLVRCWLETLISACVHAGDSKICLRELLFGKDFSVEGDLLREEMSLPSEADFQDIGDFTHHMKSASTEPEKFVAELNKVWRHLEKRPFRIVVFREVKGGLVEHCGLGLLTKEGLKMIDCKSQEVKMEPEEVAATAEHDADQGEQQEMSPHLKMAQCLTTAANAGTLLNMKYVFMYLSTIEGKSTMGAEGELLYIRRDDTERFMRALFPFYETYRAMMNAQHQKENE